MQQSQITLHFHNKAGYMISHNSQIYVNKKSKTFSHKKKENKTVNTVYLGTSRSGRSSSASNIESSGNASGYVALIFAFRLLKQNHIHFINIIPIFLSTLHIGKFTSRASNLNLNEPAQPVKSSSQLGHIKLAR